MHRCGLTQGLYHPLWDEGFPSSVDGTSSCQYSTQLITGDYLQDQCSRPQCVDVYPMQIVIPMIQRLFLDTWLRGDLEVTGQDGLAGYHTHTNLAEVGERCCGANVCRYSYLCNPDGCVFGLYWDPGGDKDSIAFSFGLKGWSHHIGHGDMLFNTGFM